jgi:hypothetical protein
VRSEVGGGQQKSANPVLQIPRSGFRREAGRLALTSMPADLVQVSLADGPRLLAMLPKNVNAECCKATQSRGGGHARHPQGHA